jgi:hypothetical protein
MKEIYLKNAPFGTVVSGEPGTSFGDVRAMVIGHAPKHDFNTTVVMFLTDDDPWNHESGVRGKIGYFGGGKWPIHVTGLDPRYSELVEEE